MRFAHQALKPGYGPGSSWIFAASTYFYANCFD